MTKNLDARFTDYLRVMNIILPDKNCAQYVERYRAFVAGMDNVISILIFKNNYKIDDSLKKEIVDLQNEIYNFWMNENNRLN